MKIGIIGGSGFDDPQIIENYSTKKVFTPYGEISSEMVVGKIGNHEVFIISRHGKNHSFTPTNVPYQANIWALKNEHCDFILATTACGSLQEEIKPGDFVLPAQFIDFTKRRAQTFFENSVVHTSMPEPFDKKLITTIEKVINNLNLSVHLNKTVITIEGPRFSTKAESLYFQKLGADIINMTSSSETILANELKIPYLALGLVTDYDCWKENEAPVSWEIIKEQLNSSAEKAKTVIFEFIKSLPSPKKIVMIGSGYVGLVSGTCFAELGNDVICVDNDLQKINKLKTGESPFFEPGLNDLLQKNIQKGNLRFSDDLTSAIADREIAFICVGTPPKNNGEADLSAIYNVAKIIGQNLPNNLLVVTKSTVPIGTYKKIKKIIEQENSASFYLASCPEFLREGSAISDFFNGERIIIGTESEFAKNYLVELHQELPAQKVCTKMETAEMIKYASNAFLATKISFINEIANLCEVVGANVKEVAHGMGLDKRIGSQFLQAGIGYGGSCFPKDVRALNQISGQSGYNFQLLKAVIEINYAQKWNFYRKIKNYYHDFNGKKIAIWGLSFKANTDDIRESIALDLIEKLLEEGATIEAYDPQASKNVRQQLGNAIKIAENKESVLTEADGLIIFTEWAEFKNADISLIKNSLKNKVIFDGKNIFDREKIEQQGLIYFGMGQ